MSTWANRVDVIPSTNIRYQFVGRGGNDTIHLNDLDPRVDVRVLTKTAGRNGFWRFSNGNRDVVFENFGVI